MNRSIGIERVFNLGEYKSLRVSDHANDIPEELVVNKEFMDNLRYLQLVEIEKTYYTYVGLSKSLLGESDDEKLNILNEISTNVYSKLLELYENTKNKKGE